MPTLSDARYEALRAQGFAGATSDMMLEWAREAAQQPEAQLNDALHSYFNARGFGGTLADQWDAYLLQRGFTGAANDKRLAFWLDGGVLEPLP